MFRKIWKGADRRRHRRLEAAVELEVQVEMYGFEGESTPFFATGRTINISRGGVYAALDAPVGIGSVCKVFFRGADDRVAPAHVQGKVLRCEEREGGFRIAVEFDEPLERLQVPEAARVTEPANG